MYVSRLNIQKDGEAIKKYLSENAFATLITSFEGKSMATHTPLVAKEEEGQLVLYGHIARANEQVATLKQVQEVLAIFMEKHTYISSSWYDHVNVPTWNYIAVHVYGTLTLLDEDATLQSLNELVAKYEIRSEKPFHISQMTPSDVKAHLRGLVAFKIKATKVDANWKLSQNRDDNNYYEIIRQLRERGDSLSVAIADEMEKMRKNN